MRCGEMGERVLKGRRCITVNGFSQRLRRAVVIQSKSYASIRDSVSVSSE